MAPADLAAADAAAGPASARNLLVQLCQHAKNEPACDPKADLSEDQAWVLVNAACRNAETAASSTCQEFRKVRGGVLTYDAATKTWAAEWGEEPRIAPLKYDVAGVPTLRLMPSLAPALKVIVANISPLAYKASPGPPKEDDIGIATELKTMLALAGSGIQGLVQIIASTYPVPPADSATTNAQLESPQAIKPLSTGATKASGPAPCKAPLEAPDVSALVSTVATRNADLNELGQALDELESALGFLPKKREEFVQQLQLAEDGDVAVGNLDEPTKDELARLTKAFGRIETLTAKLSEWSRSVVTCQPLFTAYGYLLGAPANRSIVKVLAAKVEQAAGSCRIEEIPDTLRRSASALPTGANCDTELKDALKLHAEAMKPFVERLANAATVEAKVWQAVDKALASKAAVNQTAETLAREVAAAKRHSWGGTLVRELPVTRLNPTLPWNKVQSQSIVLTPASPYTKDLRLSHAVEEKHDYRLESATGQVLGFAIGVIYTPLSESTWTAVAQPDGTGKVIAESKRETRAGSVAAILSYRFMEHWRRPGPLQPTIDAGVGLTTGTPAFFFGGGIEVKRALRIGAGWSPQKVSKLAAGQTVNVTPVSGNDDIRTERAFNLKNWYISFSFALDALSLFNKS